MSQLKDPVHEGDNYQGSLDAPLVLVEYGDYQCPYCGEAYGVIKQVQKHFGDKLCFVFRDFPLTQIHEQALAAALVADFAAKYDKFWPVHDALYEHQKRLGNDLYQSLAHTYELPMQELIAEIQDKTAEEKITHDFKSGVRSGVNGTPSFFINGEHYKGPAEAHALIATLEAVLARA
ncbi:MAG: DsbA family protein [Thiolinea sp.]